MEEFTKGYKKSECKYLTHDFHPYPHKIIPQIAKALIEKYTDKGDTVLDLFCGSGTSLLEANLLGINAIGVDVNPLACLIAKVKTHDLDIEKLNQCIKAVIKDTEFHLTRDGTLQDYTERLRPKMTCFKDRDKWFCDSALSGLSVVKELIKRIDDTSIKDFCMVAFSGIIKEVSQASSFYHLTKSKNPKHMTLFRVKNLFKLRLQDMVRKMQEYSKKKSTCFVKVMMEDARTVNFDALMAEVDFVILNVPKFNMDFERCFKIYSWWLDFDITLVNKSIIGTMKRKEEYYRDIEHVLQKTYEMLKCGKYCAFIVTDSYEGSEHLEHGNEIKRIGLRVGFKLSEQIVRTIPKKLLPFATKDRMEDILIFKKSHI